MSESNDLLATSNEMFLKPVYDKRQSFYDKAVIVFGEGEKKLKSYNELVAVITAGGKPMVCDKKHSSTTMRHIKEFLKQAGFYASTPSQILKDYGVQYV